MTFDHATLLPRPLVVDYHLLYDEEKVSMLEENISIKDNHSRHPLELISRFSIEHPFNVLYVCEESPPPSS